MPMVIGTRRTRRWTRADLARLPDDGNRYEVLDGELLVTPQARPFHQIVAGRLARALAPYCEAHGLGTVVGPGAVVWAKNELRPDVMVIPPGVRIPMAAKWEDFPTPALVIEVLSPGSERHDLGKKRDAYLRIGVRDYWVVDPERRRVLVFRPGVDEPVTESERVRWVPRHDVPPLELVVEVLLAEQG